MEEEKITKNTETEVSLPVTKVSIVPNWREVFFTYSFFFHALSVVLTFVDQLLPFMNLLQPVLSDNQYAIAMFSLNGLGLLSRFIKQKKLWEYPAEDNGNANNKLD